MKTVIVQVTREYLCLTCCEPIIQAKDQKKEATVDLSYRFTAPYVKPLDTKYMEGKETVWEIPKAFATMVSDGLREMKRPEVKEVILLVEDFDLVSSEFQHVRCKKKMLDNIAVENLKEVLQDDVKQFSVITTTYGTPPKEVPEMTSKTFGIPRALSAELAKRFSEMGLTLVKITPADVPLLKIAREIVYSFNKTVCYISVDYAALRVTLVKDSLPLYCHTFHSPVTEAVDIIRQDRQLDIPQAIEYIKQNGFDLEYDSRHDDALQRISNVREDLMADVVHNINLVAMSLDLNIDQVVVSDVVGGEVDRWGETRHADTELDVIDKETVAIGILAAVLGVGPCEGVGARGHDVRIVVPASHILPVRELQHSVNEVLTYIPVRSLAHALGIEGDVAGVGVVIGRLDGGSRTLHSRVAASHTVSAAVVAAVGGIHDDPRIGGIIDEGILAEVARLEVDDVRNDDDASCGSETRRYPFAVAQGTALVGDPHVVGGDGVEPGQRQIGVKRGFKGR